MSQIPAKRTGDSQTIDAMNELIRNVGGDPDSFSGQLVREMMHTSLKLIRDGADTGELKLISRSLKELRYAAKVFRPYRERRKVAVFGSARTPEDHPEYKAAVKFSRSMFESDWMVITGAGGGIMAAGHGGAGREASFGVAIRLPFETTANKIIAGDEKLITFRYFFTRKLIFVWNSDALACFPGGYGTHDEGFEVLTLIQTGKSNMVPIVMVDQPGGRYWKEWDQYIKDHLLKNGMISPEDLHLYKIADSPEDAAAHIRQFYSNYHSQRYVKDDLVIRMLRPLSQKHLDALNDEFADLIGEGQIQQSRALEGEREVLNLPRLHFVFTKRSYGRLRQMIDRINEYGA